MFCQAVAQPLQCLRDCRFVCGEVCVHMGMYQCLEPKSGILYHCLTCSLEVGFLPKPGACFFSWASSQQALVSLLSLLSTALRCAWGHTLLDSFFKIFILFFVYEYFASIYVWVPLTCLVPTKFIKGIRYPVTGIRDSCELPHGY